MYSLKESHAGSQWPWLLCAVQRGPPSEEAAPSASAADGTVPGHVLLRLGGCRTCGFQKDSWCELKPVVARVQVELQGKGRWVGGRTVNPVSGSEVPW